MTHDVHNLSLTPDLAAYARTAIVELFSAADFPGVTAMAHDILAKIDALPRTGTFGAYLDAVVATALAVTGPKLAAMAAEAEIGEREQATRASNAAAFAKVIEQLKQLDAMAVSKSVH